jgi:hypothetical protein
MLFIEWWIVGRLLLLLTAMIAACLAIWVVRGRTKWLRWTTVIFGYPVIVFAVLFFALQVLASGCQSYSSPVYSPDRSQAVRIRTDDEGAMGGNSTVELFSEHGLHSKDVYWGEWRSVDVSGLHWTTNSKLEVRYEGPMYTCESTKAVTVRCIDQQPSIAPSSGPDTSK